MYVVCVPVQTKDLVSSSVILHCVTQSLTEILNSNQFLLANKFPLGGSLVSSQVLGI